MRRPAAPAAPVTAAIRPVPGEAPGAPAAPPVPPLAAAPARPPGLATPSPKIPSVSSRPPTAASGRPVKPIPTRPAARGPRAPLAPTPAAAVPAAPRVRPPMPPKPVAPGGRLRRPLVPPGGTVARAAQPVGRARGRPPHLKYQSLYQGNRSTSGPSLPGPCPVCRRRVPLSGQACRGPCIPWLALVSHPALPGRGRRLTRAGLARPTQGRRATAKLNGKKGCCGARTEPLPKLPSRSTRR